MVSFTFSFPILQKTKLQQSLKDRKENQEVINKDLEGCQQPNINIFGTPNFVTSVLFIPVILREDVEDADCLTNHCSLRPRSSTCIMYPGIRASEFVCLTVVVFSFKLPKLAEYQSYMARRIIKLV